MIPLEPAVFLVDDDASTLKVLGRSLRASGFNVLVWNSVQGFLDEHDRATPGCLVIDFALPGVSGLEVQNTRCSGGCAPAVVFLSDRTDAQTVVRAMKTVPSVFLRNRST